MSTLIPNHCECILLLTALTHYFRRSFLHDYATTPVHGAIRDNDNDMFTLPPEKVMFLESIPEAKPRDIR